MIPGCSLKTLKIKPFPGSEILVRDDEMASANIVIGFNTPSVRDEDHLKLELAKVVAGSWDTTAPSLNSGINMANVSRDFLF